MSARRRPTTRDVVLTAAIYLAITALVWRGDDIRTWLAAHLQPATDCITLPSPGHCAVTSKKGLPQ